MLLKGAVFALVLTSTVGSWGSLLAGTWNVRKQPAPEDTKRVKLLWVRAGCRSKQLGRIPRRAEELGGDLLWSTLFQGSRLEGARNGESLSTGHA